MVVLGGLAVIVAWPALRQPPRDGFPLSTYPMFASDRGTLSVVATAVGVTDGGTRVRLSPEALAGTDEPMLAVSTARRAVEAGHAEPWCAEVAGRVADGARRDGRVPLVAVEVVVESHDAVAFFAGDGDPLDVDVRARCEVPPA